MVPESLFFSIFLVTFVSHCLLDFDSLVFHLCFSIFVSLCFHFFHFFLRGFHVFVFFHLFNLFFSLFSIFSLS